MEGAAARLITRRTALRRSAGTVIALTSACSVTGCAIHAAASARPAVAEPVTTVPFQLYVVGIDLSASTRNLIQAFVDRSFNSLHKGIRAVWQPQISPPTIVTLASGTGAPWILAGCCVWWPQVLPFLERLDPYLQTANIPTSLWSRRQLTAFQQPDGLYALPEDAASECFLYRQDILDSLGLPYPSPDWDWIQARALWEQCSTVQGTHRRYGVAIPFNPTAWMPEGFPLLGGFGGALMDATRTRCLLDQPGSIACGQYFLHMVWNGVATAGDGFPNPGIFDGTVVFTQGAEPTIIYAVQRLGTGTKWDFIAFPRWPRGPLSILHNNFYGLNAEAQMKDLAWELLQFAAIDPAWSRFYMRLALAPPGQPRLLEEWKTVLQTVAPVLSTKALDYWIQPTLGDNSAYDFEFFQYQPLQAAALLQKTWVDIWNHKSAVTEGFRTITQQVNALETASRSQAPPPSAAQIVAATQKRNARLNSMFRPQP